MAGNVSKDIYQGLDRSRRDLVAEATARIRRLQGGAAEAICEIGRELIRVKSILGHGSFGEWLAQEFDWSERTSNRFMLVARRFADFRQIGDFAPSALYLLAESSVPDEVIQEVAEEASAEAKKITHHRVKQILAQRVESAIGSVPEAKQQEVRELIAGDREERIRQIESLSRQLRHLHAGIVEVADQADALLSRYTRLIRSSVSE